jgi:predicted permease
MDIPILLLTVAVSAVAGLLFALFPALQFSKPNLVDDLRESGASSVSANRKKILGVNARALLVVGQVGLSVVLLIGATLLMKSFVRLRNVNPGFQPDGVLTAKIALPPLRYDTPQKRAAFFDGVLSNIEVLPGVESAAVAMSLPTTSWTRTNIMRVEGRPPLNENEPLLAIEQSVTPTYFQTLGIPMKAGRAFTARDNAEGAPPTIIINERLAHQLWPDYPRGVNPVGQRIMEGYDKAVGWFEIVGVSADAHEGGLAMQAPPEFYVPSTVHPPQSAYLAVRTKAAPQSIANTLREQVRKIDPDQPISDVKTMNAVIDATLGQRRGVLWLLGSFAGIALLLAVIGIYGVVAYSVAQRTQEMGIRRALGAQRQDILRLVLRQALVLAVSGVVFGSAAAFALTRVLKKLLYGVTATDPSTFVIVAVLFVAITLIAAYIPATRAARIDPMTALRVG